MFSTIHSFIENRTHCSPMENTVTYSLLITFLLRIAIRVLSYRFIENRVHYLCSLLCTIEYRDAIQVLHYISMENKVYFPSSLLVFHREQSTLSGFSARVSLEKRVYYLRSLYSSIEKRVYKRSTSLQFC
jgi:hypothetical protein